MTDHVNQSPWQLMHPITRSAALAARAVIAGNSHDVADCRDLLEMLGLSSIEDLPD